MHKRLLALLTALVLVALVVLPASAGVTIVTPGDMSANSIATASTKAP